MCIFLIGSLAIFLAGTFIFLAAEAFYEMHVGDQTIMAYLAVTAGAMIFSCAAFKLIQMWLCRANEKKDQTAQTKVNAVGPILKFALSVFIYEALKLYLHKNKK